MQKQQTKHQQTLENTLYNQGAGGGFVCRGGIEGARVERRASKSSCRLAERACSSAKAALTAESSFLRRALSSRTASTCPETGGRGGRRPYLEADPSIS